MSQSTFTPMSRREAAHTFRRAAALGILADLLLRAPALGLGASLWIGALALAASRPVLRAPGVTRWAALEPAAMVLLAMVAIATRTSPLLVLVALGLLASAGTLALLRVREMAPGRTGPADIVAALFDGGWTAVTGPGAALARIGRREEGDIESVGGEGVKAWVAVGVRGVFLAAPLLLLFGALFSSADPAFGAFLGRWSEMLFGDLPGHVAVATAAAAASAGGLWALRARPPSSAPRLRPPAVVGTGEVLVVLLLVNLLFAGFLTFQAGYLFGGRELVHATDGLGYADYARRGFFELVTAAAVVLPVLLASEWVARGDAREKWFRASSRVLVAMVAVLLVSAAHRMFLYQEAYGLTEDRVYTSAFMVWLALAFAWAARTVLRGRPERFPGGALRAGAVIGALLILLDPAGSIVRVNAARAAEPDTPALDVPHLLSLGADGVPEMVGLLDEVEGARRCTLARGLLRRSFSHEAGDWRGWNAARWRARRAVESRMAELREAVRSCPAEATETSPPGPSPRTDPTGPSSRDPASPPRR